MHRILAGLVLLSAVATVHAKQEVDRWIPTAKKGDIVIYMDLETMERKGDTAIAWTKWVAPTPQKLKNGKKWLVSKERAEYDCVERRFRITDAFFFAAGEDSPIVHEIHPETDSVIIPGSLAEGLREAACHAHEAPKNPSS